MDSFVSSIHSLATHSLVIFDFDYKISIL